MKKQLSLTIGEYTDKGRKEVNQDFLDMLIPKEPQLSSKGFAMAIADGISSSSVSQEASKTSVTSFLNDYFSTPDTWSVQKSAERVIASINSHLNSQSKQSQFHYDKNKGYVCTFSAMIIRSSTAYIFHAGDTRIYRLRKNEMELLTQDHLLWVSEDKSYLARALGMDSQLTLDKDTFQVQEKDIFIFMTDGIYEKVSDGFIINSIKNNNTDFKAASKFIGQKAYDEGSTDNLSIQIIGINTLPHKQKDEIQQELSEKPLPPILEARMQFDGYTVVRELSASSRSHVYLCEDNESHDLVVLKIPSIDLQEDKAYLERFMMEEWIAIRINNAHVAKSYLQTRQRNFLYTVTEYIEGQTLTQWMIDNPRPSLDLVRGIIEQIAKGLRAFHRQEMIHQDLRPANIMIDKSGTVKIIDFGSTKVEGILDINSDLQEENLLGTALYSAPEYFLAQIGSTRSDIFSLGVITYEMLSGDFPYGANIARSTTKASQKKLKYKSLEDKDLSIPIWVDEALKKALEIHPYKRYQELSEFVYDLSHPNADFVNRTRAPLVEREPVLVWKGISFVLFCIILILVSQ
ncbi:bifunctional protein-serine/threonine kinase/phosphatase [Sulfurimonas sp. MAG313]|nr:bifunctional protein-serine/threonine kinase/phosphatase [Sulfurimonas sp. MAG313]MDF1882254.1 bifunctional protein-serine/threonine kinase/phosphatase [Sulfurimonas sp. MAG313]